MKPYHQTLTFFLLLGIGLAPIESSARDVQLRDRPGSGEDVASPLPQPQRVNTESMSAEDRIRRLERILESQGLVGLMVQLQELQQEMQRLVRARKRQEPNRQQSQIGAQDSQQYHGALPPEQPRPTRPLAAAGSVENAIDHCRSRDAQDRPAEHVAGIVVAQVDARQRGDACRQQR